jgi:hypothetical protein
MIADSKDAQAQGLKMIEQAKATSEKTAMAELKLQVSTLSLSY